MWQGARWKWRSGTVLNTQYIQISPIHCLLNFTSIYIILKCLFCFTVDVYSKGWPDVLRSVAGGATFPLCPEDHLSKQCWTRVICWRFNSLTVWQSIANTQSSFSFSFSLAGLWKEFISWAMLYQKENKKLWKLFTIEEINSSRPYCQPILMNICKILNT